MTKPTHHSCFIFDIALIFNISRVYIQYTLHVDVSRFNRNWYERLVPVNISRSINSRSLGYRTALMKLEVGMFNSLRARVQCVVRDHSGRRDDCTGVIALGHCECRRNGISWSSLCNYKYYGATLRKVTKITSNYDFGLLENKYRACVSNCIVHQQCRKEYFITQICR